MRRILASAALAGAVLAASGTANAGNVAWSISVGSHGGGAVAIGLPVVPAPVYAPPVMYAPTVVHAPPVYYAPRVVHVPAPRVRYHRYAHPVALPYYGHPYAVVPVHRNRGKGHWKHHRH
jgi:hypothetical protein